MRSKIPEKLLAIVEEIDARGCANLTRLTVLKKWFERPDRLPAFGLWVAQRSAGHKGRTKGPAGALLDEAHALLGSTAARGQPAVDRRAALSLHDRARDFQNEPEQHRWASVRIIHCWPLLLVEKGLALHLRLEDSPTAGYKLAADFCQHYDPKYGNSLCGPGRTKIMEIVRFMFTVEATEDDPGRPAIPETATIH
ncbi:MAG: hypothetical protein ACOZE5_03185 [Verrucomicrobiota bacterium]